MNSKNILEIVAPVLIQILLDGVYVSPIPIMTVPPIGAHPRNTMAFIAIPGEKTANPYSKFIGIVAGIVAENAIGLQNAIEMYECH